MKATQKTRLIGAGMMVFSAALFGADLWLHASKPYDAFGFVAIVLMVVFAWGAANVLWMAEKSLSGLGAPLLLLIGFFIMVVSALSGSMLFAMGGGFMATIGAILLFLK